VGPHTDAGCEDLISPFPKKPKGMHCETFPHLEQKDFEASREKMLIMSAEISRLEVQFGVLPGEEADDVLEIG
jgi:hypothetical protein